MTSSIKLVLLSQVNLSDHLQHTSGSFEKLKKPMLTVVTTRAGTNLIRKKRCLGEALKEMTRQKVCVSHQRHKNRMHVLGIVKLTVTIGSQTRPIPLAVFRNLGVDVILGTTLTDRYE